MQCGETIQLDERAFQHAIKVLRLKQGYQLQLFDGNGHEFLATIQQIEKRRASVLVTDEIRKNTESPLHLHLGLAVSKGERMDYAIQKAVELGVSQITPLFSDHCVVNLDAKRLQKRMQHWQGVIISACEQCGRNQLPQLHSATALTAWVESLPHTMIAFNPEATQTLQQLVTPQDNTLALLIGPEGGFSNEEISWLATQEHVQQVQFGPRILRTETAAVAAITALQLLWGDLLQQH